MIVIHDPAELKYIHPSVVSIGKFDGLHLGHVKILREAKALCGKKKPLILFSFSRSPQAMISGEDGGNLLTRTEQRDRAERLGADILVEYPFDERTRRIPAEEFLERILLGELGMCDIVAGPDCSFGYQRKGSVEFLRQQSRGRYGVHVVEKERWQGEVISSTRIREALGDGRPEDAAQMLGYSYGFTGEILHGRALGRTLGFPTINLPVNPGKLAPRHGVYAVWVKVDGRTRKGIANVGVKPTISGINAAGVETYIYDFDSDVYGHTAEVRLQTFFRPEKTFPDLESLKTQVMADREAVRRYWEEKK